MAGKVVNLAGRKGALKYNCYCYMWQLLFCLDIKYHGCLGTIRMNSCQINLSTSFLWWFDPPWICHGGAHLGWVACSQGFSRTTSWTNWFGSSSALHVSLWHEHKPGRASGFSEMMRLQQHLSDSPSKCLGRDVPSRSCSLPLCQSTVLTFSKKQNKCCPALSVLPSPFKPRICPGFPGSYSHSAKLVFQQGLIKRWSW